MFIEDGVIGIKNIKDKFLDIKVIIFIIFKDDEFIKGVIFYGVDGYVLKSSFFEYLVELIKVVL